MSKVKKKAGTEMKITLEVTILTHCGETEDDVYKHLADILYNADGDVIDVG